MGFSVHIADRPDVKGTARAERVIYAGAEDLAKAKELADEAVAKKAKGDTTCAYVEDNATEQTVHSVLPGGK